MKIDCPHCGVHGSVDDSLVGKKLRCPKCSKVFLVSEELLSGSNDAGLMGQENLYNDEPESPVIEEQADLSQDSGEAEDATGEELAAGDDTELQLCSACGQSFAPEFLVEIDSRLYCALCQPKPEEEIELQEEGDVVESAEEEPLEIEEESFSEQDEDAGEEEIEVSWEADDDLEEEAPELETCSGCGESLHPGFLETVGSKRYCALCLPEDEEDDDDLAAEADLAHAAEAMEGETDSAETLLSEEDDFDKEGDLRDVCSVCGESFHPDFLQEVDSKLYCGICQPEVIEVSPEDVDDEPAASTAELTAVDDTDVDVDVEEDVEEDEQGIDSDFTVGEVLKEAWQKTKGAKGAIWGGVIVMNLILFGLGFGAAFALQGGNLIADPNTAMGVNAGVQLITTWLSTIFTSGLMLIGVRRALRQRVSWKMVFSGFSKALSITVALILQTILICIGFILLVLPGIYMSVGYGLTLPLILEKGLGPWEAMEASRKAIHKKWWVVFGIYLVMGLIYLVSIIPLGLGLIWTVPMFFLVMGVLYRLFFASPSAEEEMVDEEIDEEAEQEDDEAEAVGEEEAALEENRQE